MTDKNLENNLVPLYLGPMIPKEERDALYELFSSSGEEPIVWYKEDKIRILNNSVTEIHLPEYHKANICHSIGNFNNLKSLYLSRTGRIENLPKEIGNLKNLEQLSLSGNCLKIIPKEIGNLKNLQYLDLSYNKIEEIPKEIANLENLKLLDLQKNLLSQKSKKFLEELKQKKVNLRYDK